MANRAKRGSIGSPPFLEDHALLYRIVRGVATQRTPYVKRVRCAEHRRSRQMNESLRPRLTAGSVPARVTSLSAQERGRYFARPLASSMPSRSTRAHLLSAVRAALMLVTELVIWKLPVSLP